MRKNELWIYFGTKKYAFIKYYEFTILEGNSPKKYWSLEILGKTIDIISLDTKKIPNPPSPTEFIFLRKVVICNFIERDVSSFHIQPFFYSHLTYSFTFGFFVFTFNLFVYIRPKLASLREHKKIKNVRSVHIRPH